MNGNETGKRGAYQGKYHSNRPFNVEDGVRFITFETAEETFLLPYISLRVVRFIETFARTSEGMIELGFDQALVQIKGTNLKAFLPEIQRERLAMVRSGIAEDLELPQIESVQVLLPEK